MAREKDIEQYLKETVRKHGGLSYKWTSPGTRGVPDRICVFPDNQIIFVETKGPGEPLRPNQIRQHRLLTERGAHVFVADCSEVIDLLGREYGRRSV